MKPEITYPSYEITHPLIEDLSKGVFEVVKPENIEGIYLGGSLAIGGFEPHTSDLDFLVVLSSELAGEDITALRAMHTRIRESNKNRLYTNYEGDYITKEQAKNPLIADIVSPHLGTDGHFDVEGHGASMVIDLWKIRKSGFVVYGEDPSAVIGDISTEEMLAAKTELFKSWWLPKLERRDELDAEYQAYAILTMARILYGLVNKDEVSKKKSAQWLRTYKPEFADLIEKASSWKEGESLDEQEGTYDLIAYVDSVIEKE